MALTTNLVRRRFLGNPHLLYYTCSAHALATSLYKRCKAILFSLSYWLFSRSVVSSRVFIRFGDSLKRSFGVIRNSVLLLNSWIKLIKTITNSEIIYWITLQVFVCWWYRLATSFKSCVVRICCDFYLRVSTRKKLEKLSYSREAYRQKYSAFRSVLSRSSSSGESSSEDEAKMCLEDQAAAIVNGRETFSSAKW